jgi:hypothetical protein
MFSKELIRCLSELEEINKVKGRKRIELLKKHSNRKCFYLILRELAHNIAVKSIKTPPRVMKKLIRHRAVTRKLVKGVKGVNNKKKLITQSGGFLAAVLPFILPLLSTAINAAI